MYIIYIIYIVYIMYIVYTLGMTLYRITMAVALRKEGDPIPIYFDFVASDISFAAAQKKASKFVNETYREYKQAEYTLKKVER